jgi:quercetin dioxygenase-like cupin family protein
MKTARTLVGLAAASILFSTAALAQAQQGRPAKKGSKAAVVYASSDKLTYTGTVPKVSTATVWGDPEKGAYSVFTKFEPGFDAPLHTHPNDVSIVVIKGAYLYRDESGEKRVGPGEFIRIPGGHRHWSGGDASEGAQFYQHGAARFDLKPAK